ncbi:cytochrome C oxidase subunit IV family protein [Nocardia carnea]|uniref:cytochrome C oxidase subunit IV family protein n=1 Tax=Nocardia carnea TaxID=37328 RepID=UPI0024559603|nr:cytochrome C oxidase subunit IV family protein [Nocardia carnea]
MLRIVSARATTVVWLSLSAITLLSWALAPGHGAAPVSPSTPITMLVVVLGAVKGRLIIRYFMEARTAPRWLGFATDAWLIVLWGSVLGIYLW